MSAAASSHPVPGTVPGFWRAVGRALLLRCPLCGGRRAWLRGWFGHDERCRTCGIRYERGMVGFELGSMTINVILTFGAVIVVMVAGLVAGVATVPLVIATVAVGVAVPLLAYPFTQTVWFAVDLSMRRPEATELAEAAAWRAERAAAPG